MSQYARPVVVGVDGSEANLGAVLYAVAEAQRLETVLRPVHVVPDQGSFTPLARLASPDLSDAGRAVLRTVELRIGAVAPDLTVESRLRHGVRAEVLGSEAETAGVLVVGRDDRPVVERLLRGDTATAVAARAAVPVVQVPAEWRPDRPSCGAVVAAVKSPSHVDELLADAFAQAASRGAELEVVHAWALPSGYDDLRDSPKVAASWEHESMQELDMLLARWRRAYPDVPVRPRVVHDHPAHALVDAAEHADLLLLLRHGPPSAVQLGTVARAVLRSAACPVRVIPPTDAAAIPDLVLEEAGGLLA